MRYRVLLSFAMVFLVTVGNAGCAGAGTPAIPSDEPTTPSTSTAEPQPTTSVPTPSAEPTVDVVPPGAQGVVALARVDLAERLGVEREAIEVISVEPVEWSDASLGCPEPGQMYAQVVTPGFRVVLEARGERYEYHTDRERTVVLCEEEAVMGTPTAPSPIEPELDNLIQSAKEDLAQRVSINPSQIEVVEARSVVWPNAAMGCPQPFFRPPVTRQAQRVFRESVCIAIVQHNAAAVKNGTTGNNRICFNTLCAGGSAPDPYIPNPWRFPKWYPKSPFLTMILAGCIIGYREAPDAPPIPWP